MSEGSTQPIVVVDYDPTWPVTFDAIRAELERALRGVAVIAIEHVGSTSVPGLPAKPIIDIDVVVAHKDVADATAALETAGYTALGDLGIVDRYAFRAPPTAPRQNLYVTVAGCLSLRNHLGVRDVLRADPALRDQYAAVKRQLAASTDDISVYVEGKTEVVRRILAKAGITDSELDSIEAANRP